MLGHTHIDKERVIEYAKKNPSWTDDNWSAYFYKHQNEIRLSAANNKRTNDPLGNDRDLKMLLDLMAHLEDTGQKMEVYSADDFASVVGYNNIRFVLPSELVPVTPLADYDSVPGTNMRMLGNGAGGSMDLIPAPKESRSVIQERQAEAKAQLQALEKEKKDIEQGKAPELAQLQAQLEAVRAQLAKKQAALLAQLKEKEDELAEKKKELEKEIAILETQIYGIRCYTGEVVSFHTIRDGAPAPEDMPIVIYQKIRYLDEELGKYLSLYDYGDGKDDKEQLLSVLKHHDGITDILCPPPKSISVAKISRTGTVKGAQEKVANVLADYKMFHENQLAVLIRNGEQIHISWLDADRINLSNENIFYRPENKGSEACDTDDPYAVWRQEKAEKIARKEMLSRWFFFSILQGVLDNTNLIMVPGQVNVTDMNSPYIRFSLAEGWVVDNRYGTFVSMVEKSKDIPLKEGDMVLTGMNIGRDDRWGGTASERWNNDRGIGSKNRTCGLQIPGRKIFPVNKVVPGIKVHLVVQKLKVDIKEDPHGDAMYEHASPDGSTYQSNRAGNDGKFLYYVTTYNTVPTDELLETVEETVTLSGEHWYGYRGIYSYRKLTKEHLAGLSRIYKDNLYVKKGNKEETFRTGWKNEGFKALLADEDSVLFRKKVVKAEVIGETDHEYYISVEGDSWEGKEYRVNFRFYPGEVIPLPFLCSTWVESVIRNGKIGDYRLCGTDMGYADMLLYLNKSLEHLREREETEKEMLTKAGGVSWVTEHPDWDAVLCEWKIRNRIHALTPTRAKRFLKELQVSK